MRRITGKRAREERRRIARHLGVSTSALQFFAHRSRMRRPFGMVGYRVRLSGVWGEKCNDRLCGYPLTSGVSMHFVVMGNPLGAETEAEYNACYYANGYTATDLFARRERRRP